MSDPLRNVAGPSAAGGASGGGRNPPAPPALPPSLRPHGLTNEEVNAANQKFPQVKLSYPDDWNDNIGYLTYKTLVDRRLPTDNIENWTPILTELFDEEGRHKIREVGLDPFIHQINHMLRLCGLTPRSWNLILRSVLYDTSEAYKSKVEKMVYACRYQGFDPSLILKRIIRYWRDGRRIPLQEFRLMFEGEVGPVEWFYSNHSTLIDDMTFLITIFLNRGAVIDKICKKSSADFTAVMRMLVAKYHIRANEAQERRRRAEALGPEVITLPRIAACFAQLTTNLFAAGHGRVIISTADFPDCPSVIFSPMFPSVVRKGYRTNEVMINIHPQLILIAILMDNVLHIRDKITPLDQIWTYYLAAHNSGVMIDSARIEQCNLFEVTIDGLFNPVITGIREHCLGRIRQLRPHERIDDFIREMNTLP